MAYTTNVNLVRNGLIKNWEFKNFPQKKKIYNKQIIFIIKVYFWLRFFFLYYKIRLIQFHSNLLEGGIISCDLVINRSSFKNRNIKYTGAKKKFSKLNRTSFQVFNNYKNIIKISNLYKIKKKRISSRRKKYRKRDFVSKLFIIQLNYTSKNTNVDFINRLKTFLVLFYIKLKKFLSSQIPQSLYMNKTWIRQKILNINKSKNIRIIKKIFTKLKKYKILNLKCIKALLYYPIKRIKKKLYLNKAFSLIKIKIILEKEIYKFLLIRFNIRLRFESLIYPLTLETEDVLIRNNFSSYVLFKLTKNWYYKSLQLPKFLFKDIEEYDDFFWKRNRRQSFRHFKFKRVEKILMAAMWYNNLQLLVDFLALKIGKSRYHTKCINELCKQLEQLHLQGSTPVFRYRIGLYGRVNNATRSRVMFFSSKNFKKLKRGTYTTKLYFAEARTTAKIGVFHIRIWLELLNN
jgi:hypothetical protein